MSRELDRELLRRAGEHLGTLAEQARESRDMIVRSARRSQWIQRERRADDEFRRLDRLSREVLEIANG